ncbi:uncharacterized protein Dwil_GK24063 [Drosophila willistoni]|uniref:Ionotropic glutamate receptor C-terminal domain-containing protein n=1 Tax=Drosophila willistoni TaxID=7260 RepID=B4N6S4_DROWI|nr:uncharacterized protein Dwil_GK24063 [Drosophila willistoni]
MGMVHILVLIPEIQQLYSYMPYPELNVLNLTDTEQYYQRTRALLWNFHGYAINCGVVMVGAPRAFMYRDDKNNDIYAGYMLNMVLAFIAHHNGTIRTRPVYTLKEAYDSLSNRSIDFLPFLVLPTTNFTRSVILFHENLFVMAPTGGLMPRFVYLMKPYTRSTWLIWLTMIIYCSGALYVTASCQEHNLNFSLAFLQILCLSLFLPAGATASRHLVIFVLLTVAGFMLTNLYLAQLSTSLAAGLYEKQVNTFDDLPGTDLTLPVIETEIKHFHQLPDIHPELASRMIVTSELLVDIYRRQLNTSYLHCGYEDRIDFALYQQKFLRPPLFHKLTKIVDQQPFQIPIRYGLPYLQIFNRYMRRAFEGGIWLKLRTDSFADGIRSGQLHFFNGARYMKVKSNDLQYYYVIGAIWLMGMILAIFCFIYEFVRGQESVKA